MNLFDLYRPTKLRTIEDVRAQLLTIFLLCGLITSVIIYPIESYLDNDLPNTMWLIGAILLLLSIKCGLPNVLTSNLTVLLLFKSLTTSSIISDSIFITNYANVFLVFICAAAFTGRTATFIWALICLTYYIYCFNFSTPNAELELLYDRLDYKPYYKFAYDLATIALPCFMYAIYTIFSNRIINKTKETRLKLEQNHQELTNQSKYLLATKAQLEDSNQKLERYAHMVSHDMKQPIRTITSFTQLLSKRLTQLNLQDEKATEYINFIVQGTKGMDSLIQEILNYSMKTTDQSGSSVKAQESLDIALSNLSALINDNEIELEVGALPTVNITSSHLVQIFQNLISNAIKYKKPHIPLSLKITVFEKTDHFLFKFQDNGIGIDSCAIKEIFSLYNQSDFNSEGQGIGLATCKQIVSSYGGHIWAESEVGVGSIFYFSTRKAYNNKSYQIEP